ncbi:MAG: hypothetical protein NPINA01_05070 [Nitrospinaceae bacterium]|nr:MAG: hypothetical protein NPINA01_05070 [Nitrospinaceae bacterium]
MAQSKPISIVLLIGILLLGFPYGAVDAKVPSISLNKPTEGMSRITISKDTPIRVSNDFRTALYNLIIVKFSSGKKMVSIDEFLPGQTFDMEFVREGTYVICYSLHPKTESMKDACLQVNVGAQNQA